MAQRSDEDLGNAFLAVEDPALFHTLGELNTLKSVTSAGDTITVRIGVAVDGYPLTDEFGARLLDKLDDDDDREISLELEFLSETEGDQRRHTADADGNQNDERQERYPGRNDQSFPKYLGRTFPPRQRGSDRH